MSLSEAFRQEASPSGLDQDRHPVERSRLGLARHSAVLLLSDLGCRVANQADCQVDLLVASLVETQEAFQADSTAADRPALCLAEVR